MSSITFTVKPDNCTVTGETWQVELYDPNDVTAYTDLPELTSARINWRGNEDSYIVGSECNLSFFFEDKTGDVWSKLFDDMAGSAESLLYVRIYRGVAPFAALFWAGIVANDLTTSTWNDCKVQLNLTASDGFERLRVMNDTPTAYDSKTVAGFMGSLAFLLNRVPVATLMDSDFLFVSKVADTNDSISSSRELQKGLFHPFEGLYYATDQAGRQRPFNNYESLEKLLKWCGLRVYQYGGKFWAVVDWENADEGYIITKDYREDIGSDSPEAGSIADSTYTSNKTVAKVYGNAWEGLSAAYSEVNLVNRAKNVDVVIVDGGSTVFSDNPPAGSPRTFTDTIDMGTIAATSGAQIKIQVRFVAFWNIDTPLNTPVYGVDVDDLLEWELKITSGATSWWFDGSVWVSSNPNNQTSASAINTIFGPTTTSYEAPLEPFGPIGALIPTPPIVGDLEFIYTYTGTYSATVDELTLLERHRAVYVFDEGWFKGVKYICTNIGDNQMSSFERTVDVDLWSYSFQAQGGWHTYSTAAIPLIVALLTWVSPVDGTTSLTYEQYILTAYMYRRYMMSRTFEAEFDEPGGGTAMIDATIGTTSADLYPLNITYDVKRGTMRGRWWDHRNTEDFDVEYSAEFV